MIVLWQILFALIGSATFGVVFMMISHGAGTLSQMTHGQAAVFWACLGGFFALQGIAPLVAVRNHEPEGSTKPSRLWLASAAVVGQAIGVVAGGLVGSALPTEFGPAIPIIAILVWFSLLALVTNATIAWTVRETH